MLVLVSPARRTMQVGGSYGTLIGASISAVADDRSKQRIEEVLGDYDPVAVFEERVASRVGEALGTSSRRTPALVSSAGFNNEREASRARLASLNKQGVEVVLDLKSTFGLFGPGGTLITKIEGELLDTASGRKLWENVIVVHDEPMLASAKLVDPTTQVGPDFSSMRLKADEDAISQWTRDDGTTLRSAFERQVDAAVSALLCDLGFADEMVGWLYLGNALLNGKQFDRAQGAFRKALALSPDLFEARNGLSVALAHAGRVTEAIAEAQAIVDANQDFGPAWYNLAWWYGLDKGDSSASKSCYEKALALGMPGHKKLDRVSGRDS